MIQGQSYQEIRAGSLKSVGQELARRVVLETPFGLVAMISIGIFHVSSMILTAEIRPTLHKGEEMSSFQSGGSDTITTVFDLIRPIMWISVWLMQQWVNR